VAKDTKIGLKLEVGFIDDFKVGLRNKIQHLFGNVPGCLNPGKSFAFTKFDVCYDG